VKYMLLIYGNEEAFSSVGAETFAEIVRATEDGAVAARFVGGRKCFES